MQELMELSPVKWKQACSCQQAHRMPKNSLASLRHLMINQVWLHMFFSFKHRFQENFKIHQVPDANRNQRLLCVELSHTVLKTDEMM